MVNKNLYVVSVLFNPLQWKSRTKLYNEFKEYMRTCGVQLLTVEIAFGNQPYHVTDPANSWDLQLRTHTELWHKEKGINLGIQKLLQLIPDAENVAWIDGDVRFSNPNWVKDTIEELNHYDVLQLFSEAQSLNPNHESQWKTPGVIYNFYHRIGYHQHPPIPLSYVKGGHPGLAWAAKIKTLNEVGGLLDFCIHGSGDTYMANAFMGDIFHAMISGSSPHFKEALRLWGDRCQKYINKNVGYVKGICTHYWHGKPQVRGYEQRWKIVCFHKFDPFEDIYTEANGLYRFNNSKPNLAYDLRRSMKERNEDGTDEK